MSEREFSPRAEFAHALRTFEQGIEQQAANAFYGQKSVDAGTGESALVLQVREGAEGTLLQRSVETFREQFSKIIDEVEVGNKRSLIKMMELLEKIENGTATPATAKMYRFISGDKIRELKEIYNIYKTT